MHLNLSLYCFTSNALTYWQLIPECLNNDDISVCN